MMAAVSEIKAVPEKLKYDVLGGFNGTNKNNSRQELYLYLFCYRHITDQQTIILKDIIPH